MRSMSVGGGWTLILAILLGACALAADDGGLPQDTRGPAVVHEGLMEWWDLDEGSRSWWSRTGTHRGGRLQVARLDETMLVRARIPVLKMLPGDPLRSGVEVRIDQPQPGPSMAFALLHRFTPETSWIDRTALGGNVGAMEDYMPLICIDGEQVVRHFRSFNLDADRARWPRVVATSWDGRAATFTLGQCGLPGRLVAQPWEDPELDLAIMALPYGADRFDEPEGTIEYTLVAQRAIGAPARRFASGRRDDT